MKIMKASAGSGKTYRLAKTYLSLLASSRDPRIYRHILAVTFTNKATAEMKNRILKYLSEAAGSDPRSRALLLDLLHDYGAFSVTTIDRFFQQALKAFSREVGRFSTYQIELDRDSLIEEAMDRILDSLTEDKKELISWVKSSVNEQLESGARVNIYSGLYEMGKRLKSDEHREMKERYGIEDADAFSKARLSVIRKECNKVIRLFEDEREKAREEVNKALEAAGVPANVFSRDWLSAMFKEGYVPTEAFMANSADSSKWFRKADAPRYLPLVEEPLSRALGRYCALFDENNVLFLSYNTAVHLKGGLFSLGLAGEFYKEFDKLLSEKNVMCLDDSNAILRGIIGGTDAPFIYEKLGVRYEHFLLDEFQDTSKIQWDNFLPLLRESEAFHRQNLLVGDVKQSIYRWRNSDWRLLAQTAPSQFQDVESLPLNENWRSLGEIVDFNNSFFRFASERLGVQDIYSDVEQSVRSKDPAKGFVDVVFCEDQQTAILDRIEKVRAAGAHYGDITVLVRKHVDGSAIASLLTGNGIPVISDDSLSVKSSVIVRRMVSLLSSIDSPDNGVGGYLASSLAVTMPSSWHSLPDLCETLLRSLMEADSDSFEGETLFIQAFMDDLQAWTAVNGNNLRNYLRHWDESNLFIGTPDNADSVRILTVHKAKGLEAPYIIFPYAERVELFHDEWHWCHLDTEGTPFSEAMDGIYPVHITSKATPATLFREDYENERKMQLVDNLNIFYVALTRPQKGISIIAAPSKDKSISGLLYEYLGGKEESFFGEMYDFSRMERKKESPEDYPYSYVSIPVNPVREDGSILNRLSPSTDSMDFFGEDAVGFEASPRLGGIVLHNLLSAVRTGDELEAAVKKTVAAGILSPEEAGRSLGLLKTRLDEVSSRHWFDGSAEIFSELPVFDNVNGEEYRPDRVMVFADRVEIVDYKFGEESPKYRSQVRRYVDLYRRMGYKNVEGWLWYVTEGRLEKV